jgi:hypothetical protein
MRPRVNLLTALLVATVLAGPPSLSARQRQASPLPAGPLSFGAFTSAFSPDTVVEAGPVFRHLATNSMGERLMATPALSRGVLYVRGCDSVSQSARDRSRSDL